MEKLKYHSYLFILLVLFINSCTEESTNPPEEELNDITNPPGGYINEIGINSQGDFFAGTPYGLFISTDRGSSWQSLTYMINTIIDAVDVLITSDNNIFIVCNSFVIYRSFDKGVTWTSATTSSRTNYSIQEDHLGDLYACGGALFKSTDEGSSWDIMRNGTVYNICFPNDSMIIINEPGPVAGVTLYSTDSGSSWNFANSSLNVVEFYLYNSLVFAGGIIVPEGEGGVHKSTNGGINWESCGLSQISVNSFITNKQNRLFIGTSEGIYYTDDEGETWQNVLSDSSVTTLMKDGKDYLYAGTSYGTFLRSTDGGRTWHN